MGLKKLVLGTALFAGIVGTGIYIEDRYDLVNKGKNEYNRIQAQVVDAVTTDVGEKADEILTELKTKDGLVVQFAPQLNNTCSEFYGALPTEQRGNYLSDLVVADNENGFRYVNDITMSKADEAVNYVSNLASKLTNNDDKLQVMRGIYNEQDEQTKLQVGVAAYDGLSNDVKMTLLIDEYEQKSGEEKMKVIGYMLNNLNTEDKAKVLGTGVKSYSSDLIEDAKKFWKNKFE